jgi:hypothetical protein
MVEGIGLMRLLMSFERDMRVDTVIWPVVFTVACTADSVVRSESVTKGDDSMMLFDMWIIQ